MIKYIKNINAFDKNIILVFLGASLVNLFNLLYQLIIAHRLSPSDFAAFNSLLSIFMLASAPLLTFQATVVKYTAEFNAQNQIKKVKFLLSGLLKKNLVLAILTFFIFYPASFYIMDKLKISSVFSVFILALMLALSWITPVLSGGLQGLELFKWFTSISAITGMLKLIFAFIFILLGFNIAGALGALLVSSLIGIVISLFPLKNFLSLKFISDGIDTSAAYKLRPEGRSKNMPLSINSEQTPTFKSGLVEWVDFKEIFLYLLPVAISSFCFIALVSFDMVLVKYFFMPQDSGLYSLAQMVGKIFLFLPGAISIVMFPKTAGLNAKNMNTISTLKKSLLYAAILCIIAGLIYNIFPSFVLKILTGKVFLESVILGRLFSISMSLFSFLFILITYFLSIKDLRFIKYLVLFTGLQFLGIIFFHHSLIQVQWILCVNAALLFLIHLVLAFRNDLMAESRRPMAEG